MSQTTFPCPVNNGSLKTPLKIAVLEWLLSIGKCKPLCFVHDVKQMRKPRIMFSVACKATQHGISHSQTQHFHGLFACTPQSQDFHPPSSSTMNWCQKCNTTHFLWPTSTRSTEGPANHWVGQFFSWHWLIAMDWLSTMLLWSSWEMQWWKMMVGTNPVQDD